MNCALLICVMSTLDGKKISCNYLPVNFLYTYIDNIPITRRELYNVWIAEMESKERVKAVISYFLAKSGLQKTKTEDYCNKVKLAVRRLTYSINERWIKAKRSKKYFEDSNKIWLSGVFDLPSENVIKIPEDLGIQPSTSNFGRPRSDFSGKSEKGKRLEVSALVSGCSPEKLVFAAGVSLYKSGKRDAAAILKNINESPTRATKIKKIVNAQSKEPVPYTDEEALRLFIDGKYTKASYNAMRTGAKIRNADIYPSYHRILEAKEKCYPSNGIKVSDVIAEVPLQDLVDHTACRILKLQKEVIEEFNYTELTLIYKWGCDGSSGHSTYKQNFSSNDSRKTDEYLFAICLVPLQLKYDNHIIWENPRPSSTRFCRPIKLIFEKETKSLIQDETNYIQNQINAIVSTASNIEDKTVIVKHVFYLTMIDGKVFSILSDSSTQRCGICGATPTIMNKLHEIKALNVRANLYEYGLSTLHAWIRCLECVLHISYKIEIKKWQARSESDKALQKKRKDEIISALKSEMNLLIDIPKPGEGSTNDGNTARKFFQQPSLASQITGVNESLIKRLGIILRTMSSGYAINVEAFRKYAMDTAELYVELYEWYYMPSSVHKILIHGADIIQNAALPIGMMSEEALESRNKDFRFIREHHTRKMSREKTIEDLFNYLLLSSDPLISSFSTKPFLSSRNEELLGDEDISLLLDPFIQEDVE